MPRPDRTLNSRLPLLLLAVLASAGCTVGPEPRVPAPESLGVPVQFQTSAVQPDTTHAVVADWWNTFDDPVLSRLVEQALAANTNIDAAGARVRQARAALKSTRAGWWPTLDFGASASRLMGVGSEAQVPDRTTYDAGFDARYELDLFGGQRRAVQASTADLAAVEADSPLDAAHRRRRGRAELRRCAARATPARNRPGQPGRTGRNAADRPVARAGRTRRRTRSRAVAPVARADRSDRPGARAGLVIGAEPALGADGLGAGNRRRIVRTRDPDSAGRRGGHFRSRPRCCGGART